MKHILFFSATIFLLLFSACKQTEISPSADYAPYISAFSGDMISANSTVIIEFTEEIPQEILSNEPGNKLFKFTPSIKGKSRWIDSRTVEFVPDSAELKPGTTYKAAFSLDKILKVERRFSKFVFSFVVEKSGYSIHSKPVIIEPDKSITVEAEILFNEKKNLEDVKKIFEAKIGMTKYSVDVTEDDGKRFVFAVKNISRSNDTRQLLVYVDASKAGIDRKETFSFDIPATDVFMLYEYNIIHQPDYGVQLVFSDVLDPKQDFKSMILLKNFNDYTIQNRSNNVIIYFNRPPALQTLEIVVDRGLKNAEGDILGETQTVTLSLEPLKPAVQLLTNGIIMPNTGKIILPFKAVSLRAVDLKIIRIYENNILMFLQDNSLSANASNQLKRAGRLVYRKTLKLDTEAKKGLHAWENYSIDVTDLVNRRPGDIYRIELSFRQQYAVTDCENDDNREIDAIPLTQLNVENNTLNSDDEAYWDRPDAYYSNDYDMYFDWSEYDWDERDNPCSPTYYMKYGCSASTNVFVSNLGLIAKMNSDNTVWAAVSNLLDTKPAAGVDVTAYNYQLQTLAAAKTDENGFAVLNLQNKPFLLVASQGAQKAYLRLRDGEENMLSRFDTGGKKIVKGLKGYIYGERGVWRPGDTLHLAFMLENNTNNIPDNYPVTLEMYNPQGQFYNRYVSLSGINGLYGFNVSTKQSDPTGLWNVYVKAGGATFHKSLRIETVKPNRLKIRLDLPPIIETSKATLPLALQSEWLTGATARGLDAKVELALSKVTTQFKGYDNFIFNNPATSFVSNTAEVFNGKTNEAGKVDFNMTVPEAKNAPGMLNANVICRVFEPGGDPSIFAQSLPFSPFASYVGINFNIKKGEHYLFTDEDHIFDVVTLSPAGKPLSRNNLEYRIYRIDWSWWWDSESESLASYINNTNYKPVLSGKINTVNGKGKITFRINYPEWGRYLVYVKDTESGHATGGTALVDWPSWRGRSNRQNPDGLKMLTFSLDKESYNVGDEAIVTIPATAADGHALVALENGSEVLDRKWVELKAGSDTRHAITVTEKMAPNVYIHISLLQPHAAATDLPIRMYGVMPLFVSNKESHLAPVILMPDVIKPESDFEVKISEKNNKPMTYTLAIVDEGLLDLTNFKTPDPWQDFYSREALCIRTWDMFDDVMGAFTGSYGKLFSVGGDGELSRSSSKANRFKPVVLYLGPVTLKQGETKTHKLKLPAYAGSVRVMVVAGQNGAYGNADKTVPVRSPLMILSTLPRTVSVGEKIKLPVNVFAMEDNVKNVNVKVETTGKMKPEGTANQSVIFTATGDKTVYFDLKAGSSTGMEKVTITATSGNNVSKETIEIDVRNPNPPALAYKSKILEKGESIEYDYNISENFDGNWIKVEMSRIPAIDLSRRLDFLYDYSNYCTEQLASRALPLLYVQQLKSVDETEKNRISSSVNSAVSYIYGRQAFSGGFGYWPGYISVDDWVTSYAGHFLVLAKEKGFSVSSSVLTKWIAFQRNAANSWKSGANGTEYNQAYRLYTLALAGAAEMGAMNRLKELKNMSLQARWRLAACYALCGKTDAANELIFNAATTVTPYSSNNTCYGSSVRDEAMILETLVLMKKNEAAFRQAQTLSKNLDNESHFSTQSAAYAIAAMGQFAHETSGKLDFEWSLNGKNQKIDDAKKAVYQNAIPLNPPSGKVKITNGNEGMLYTSLATKTIPLTDNLPAVNEGITLEVKYTDMKGNAMDVRQIAQGTDFYAVVKVSNIAGRTDYMNMALTHIIPSGWEIFNERMLTSGSEQETGASTVSYQDVRDDRVLTYFNLPRGTAKEIKIRLQAVYEGEYTLPAISCEAMYEPAVRARTVAEKTFVIR